MSTYLDQRYKLRTRGGKFSLLLELIDRHAVRFRHDLTGSAWFSYADFRQWRFGKIDNPEAAELPGSRNTCDSIALMDAMLSADGKRMPADLFGGLLSGPDLRPSLLDVASLDRGQFCSRSDCF